MPTATRVPNARNTALSLYPNPGSQTFTLALGPHVAERDVRDITIYDQKRALVYRPRQYQSTISPGPLAPGNYAVKNQTATSDLHP